MRTLPTGSRHRTVACIGAGPAGLLAATGIKTARPDWQVVVYERSPRGATYGYGVVFSDVAVRTVEYMAPALGAMLASQVAWSDVEVRARGRRYRIPGHGYTAVSRHRLLDELADQAQAAGVELRYETPVHLDDLRGQYDLVVAADGANSRTRQALAAELGARVGRGRSRYAWLGTTAEFDAMTFIFEETDQGVAVAHGYPHGDGVSTFVVEVPAHAGGPDRAAAVPGTADDFSPEQPQAVLAAWSDVFAEHLQGHPLQAKDLNWAHFPSIRLDRCVYENVVVIGDAAHTLHYSVGSGTRMALEDGFYLARALERHGDVPSALAEYERRRLPSSRNLQTAGERSMRWFERVPEYLDKPVAQFSLHLLGRTALPDLDQIGADAPELVADAARSLESGGSVFALPLDLGTVRLPGRLVADHTDVRDTGTTAQSDLYAGLPRALELFPAAAPGPGSAVGTVGTVVGGRKLSAQAALDRPGLTVIDAGPCPVDPALAAREAEELAALIRKAGLAGGAPIAIRTPLPPAPEQSPYEPSAGLLARLTVLHHAGLCAVVDLAAPPGRAGTADELLAALEEADIVSSALPVRTMLSGFSSRPGQVESQMLAGRIDLWCLPVRG
ncbi:FAD-dependent monooxygenase [Streptomyces sp. cmx-4-9]|uniref:FAD-dependent monooxygenase n=1 Tax=Streptomyces sp. cmx-4-9 TaxID=2790941 RepID=UPI00397FB4AC